MDSNEKSDNQYFSEDVKNGVPTAAGAAAAAPISPQLPVMSGRCFLKGGIWVWEGQWAMTPAGISIPGEHSPFSYKCSVVTGPATPFSSHAACAGLHLRRDNSVNVFDSSLVSPVFFGRRGVPIDYSATPSSGIFGGHFMMQQKGHKSLKIDEKKVALTFSEAEFPADDGAQQYEVKGKGDNKFGSFLLDGFFNCGTGVLRVTKAYLAKVPSTRRKAAPQTPAEKKRRRQSVATPAPPRTPAMSGSGATTPGSTAGRSERKRSIPGRFNDPEPLPKAARLSENLRRCQAILKTLVANNLAYPFLVPVDYVALEIPDYPKIITHPMDFGTIQKKMNLGEYASVEPFAADVRLVFKNALTFNSKDHVVHNMAKTLSGDFERMLGELMVKPVEVPTTTPAAGGKAPRGRGVKRPATASTPANGAGRKPKAESSTKKKPRAGSDSGNALVQALKDQLAAMTQKLDEVTAAQQQTTQAVQQQLLFSSRGKKEVDMNKPMSFEEKRVLSLAINKLPGDKLNKVIEIIQERMPLVGDGRNEIDVDISSLDTQTLRHLQSYVKGCTSSARKRKTPSKQAQVQAMRQAQQNQEQAEARLRAIDSQIQALTPSQTPVATPVAPVASFSAPSRVSEEVDVDTVDVIARQDSSSESSESDSDSENEDSGANQSIQFHGSMPPERTTVAAPIQNANAWASFAAPPSLAPTSFVSAPPVPTADKSALWATARQEMEKKQEREREKRAEEDRIRGENQARQNMELAEAERQATAIRYREEQARRAEVERARLELERRNRERVAARAKLATAGQDVNLDTQSLAMESAFE